MDRCQLAHPMGANVGANISLNTMGDITSSLCTMGDNSSRTQMDRCRLAKPMGANMGANIGLSTVGPNTSSLCAVGANISRAPYLQHKQSCGVPVKALKVGARANDLETFFPRAQVKILTLTHPPLLPRARALPHRKTARTTLAAKTMPPRLEAGVAATRRRRKGISTRRRKMRLE